MKNPYAYRSRDWYIFEQLQREGFLEKDGHLPDVVLAEQGELIKNIMLALEEHWRDLGERQAREAFQRTFLWGDDTKVPL